MNTTFVDESHIQDAPRVKKYIHLLIYLTEYFNYRKFLDSSFTYELWSSELGFKSTAIMYLICKGKRPLTANSVSKIVSYLKLSDSEKKHLLLLAHYHQTKSAEIKSALFDKILESADYKELNLEARQYKKFILSETMPLVRMVLAYDDIKGTQAEVLNVLDITKAQLKKDLIELEEMGLVTRVQLESSDESVWKSTTQALRFPEDTGKEIMDLFHIKTMNETSEIVKQPDVFKKLRSLILAIDPDEHQLLEDEVDQFVTKLKNKFAYKTLDNKQLIKVHCQAYQTSKTKKPLTVK